MVAKKSISSKIDIFSHIMPDKYRRELYKKAQGGFHLDAHDKIETHHNTVPALFDLERRFRVMDQYEGMWQVLTIGAPPLEAVTDPAGAAELSKLANDGMAELVAKYPDRFVGGVANLPMNNMDAALKEAERAIKELKLKGVLVYTPVAGKPLDSPEFMPLYEMMAGYDLPIWIHPVRGRDIPDYNNEGYSKYRIFHIFGWPYETTAAMMRLVFRGILDKYPNLKFITHHCGGMVPYFSQRLADQGESIYTHTPGYVDAEDPVSLRRPPIEYFKMFYGDTALGSTAGLMCGYAFLGAEHIVFGTDMPYGGESKLGQMISSVEEMTISDLDKKKIFEENANRLLHLKGHK